MTPTMMRPLSLVLTTAQGDELGRLRLPDVQVAAAGATDGTAMRPRLAHQMGSLYARITAALAQEGMMTTLDALDFQISVSQALLSPETDAEGTRDVLISLPVQESRVSATPPQAAHAPHEAGQFQETHPPLAAADTLSPAKPDSPASQPEKQDGKRDDWDGLFDLSLFDDPQHGEDTEWGDMGRDR